MSGICGIVRLDGGQVDSVEIAALTAVLERRGPEGTRQWLGGSVGLGHTLLATTPEALVESLPLTDDESGCTITADARLDNREELLGELGLDAESRVIGDGELILRAYLRWGDDCPKQLLGDFAFAIWDERQNRLFCARDHMGMRRLSYFHEPGKILVFATEPEAVLAHPLVPRRINEVRIADYLDHMEGFDLTSTFFEDVHRLPPAHGLAADSTTLSVHRYWRLGAESKLKLGPGTDYVRGFFDIFAEAVRCRLRSPGQIGSTLSGGLDSTSVALLAAHQLAETGGGPLPTFSAVGPDPQSCPETRAILSAIKSPGLSPTLISHADLADDGDELMRLMQETSEPFDGQMTLPRSVYLAAHRAGMKVILDGVAGDMVLGAGNRIAALLRTGRLMAAIDEAKRLEDATGKRRPAWKALLAATWVAYVPRRVRQLRRELSWRREDRRLLAGKALIEPGFARRVDLVARRDQFRQSRHEASSVDEEYRLRLLAHPHLVAARERYDRVASALAIEPRDPFMDIRLIRYCLSLPASELQLKGWTKLILRRAMAGILPADVAWRRGRHHLGFTFTTTLLSLWEGWREAGRDLNFLRRVPSLQFGTGADRLPSMDMETEIELCVLAYWLKRNRGDQIFKP